MPKWKGIQSYSLHKAWLWHLSRIYFSGNSIINSILEANWTSWKRFYCKFTFIKLYYWICVFMLSVNWNLLYLMIQLWRTFLLTPFKLITVFLHEASHAVACKLTCGDVSKNALSSCTRFTWYKRVFGVDDPYKLLWFHGSFY